MFGLKKENNDNNGAYAYATGDQESGSVVKTAIGVLFVIMLLGVTIWGAVFGYIFLNRYANEGQTEVVAVNTVNAVNTEKLYTEQQVQTIVAEMLKESKNEIFANNVDNKTVGTKIVKNDTSIQNEQRELINTLNNTQVDFINKNVIDTFEKNIDTNSKVTKNKDKQVDKFNKVIVEVDNSSNIDQISSQLDSLVSDVGEVKSSYTKSISKEVKIREGEMRFIVVQEGDTLSKIAKRAYGNSQYYYIIAENNPDIIKNPNRIFVGQKFRIPVI